MARFSEYTRAELEARESVRKHTVYKIINDLRDAAISLGYSEVQADTQIDLLFSTFPGEWSLFILTGSSAIITAIQNDATIPWMDSEYPPGSGVTVRERIVNRLTQA